MIELKISSLLRSFRPPHFCETSIPQKFQEVKIGIQKCRVGLTTTRDKLNVKLDLSCQTLYKLRKIGAKLPSSIFSIKKP